MYSTPAKQLFIELYESATDKLASVYRTPQERPKEVLKEEQSNETTTKR